MATFTVISEEGATEVDVALAGGRVLVSPSALDAAIGWQLKPEGLCRGEVCVPLYGRLAADGDGRVDLVETAEVLRRPTLVDHDVAALVVGISADDRRTALTDLRLPVFALPDLDGNVHASSEWPGKKKLLVAFASW